MRNLAIIFIGFFSLVVLGCSGEQEGADAAVANGDSVTAVVQDTAVEQTSALQSEGEAPVMGEKSQLVPSDSVDLAEVDLGFDESLHTFQEVLKYESKRGSIRIPDAAVAAMGSGTYLYFYEQFHGFALRTVQYEFKGDSLSELYVHWSTSLEHVVVPVFDIRKYVDFDLDYQPNLLLFKDQYLDIVSHYNNHDSMEPMEFNKYDSFELVGDSIVLDNKGFSSNLWWYNSDKTISVQTIFRSYDNHAFITYNIEK